MLYSFCDKESIIVESHGALRYMLRAASFQQSLLISLSQRLTMPLQATLQELNEILLVFTLQIIDLLSVLVHVECSRLRDTDFLR